MTEQCTLPHSHIPLFATGTPGIPAYGQGNNRSNHNACQHRLGACDDSLCLPRQISLIEYEEARAQRLLCCAGVWMEEPTPDPPNMLPGLWPTCWWTAQQRRSCYFPHSHWLRSTHLHSSLLHLVCYCQALTLACIPAPAMPSHCPTASIPTGSACPAESRGQCLV